MLTTRVDIHAVQAEEVRYGALLLGLVYRDRDDPRGERYRWMSRDGWGGAPTRDAALERVAERVRRVTESKRR